MRIKEGKFSVYEIDPMYLEYLSKYDKNVRKKSNRKYYGILITKEKTDYCIPFTSKVKKRNPKLTINIKNKKEVEKQLGDLDDYYALKTKTSKGFIVIKKNGLTKDFVSSEGKVTNLLGVEDITTILE